MIIDRGSYLQEPEVREKAGYIERLNQACIRFYEPEFMSSDVFFIMITTMIIYIGVGNKGPKQEEGTYDLGILQNT